MYTGISVMEYNDLKKKQAEELMNQLKHEKLQKSSQTIWRIKEYINANGKNSGSLKQVLVLNYYRS